MLKRLLMLLLASLALWLGLQAMVIRMDETSHVAAPAYRAYSPVPALPETAASPETSRAPVRLPMPTCLAAPRVQAELPAADANGRPVADAPYYRAAYAAFHLPDASG